MLLAHRHLSSVVSQDRDCVFDKAESVLSRCCAHQGDHVIVFTQKYASSPLILTSQLLERPCLPYGFGSHRQYNGVARALIDQIRIIRGTRCCAVYSSKLV